MLEEVRLFWPIILFIIATVVAINRWMKTRELNEIKLSHEREISDLKDNAKHDSNYNSIHAIVIQVEKEMRYLRDKASERHGELQGRIGTMELKMGQFTARYSAQLDELYRTHGIGRRASDRNDADSIS